MPRRESPVRKTARRLRTAVAPTSVRNPQIAEVMPPSTDRASTPPIEDAATTSTSPTDRCCGLCHTQDIEVPLGTEGVNGHS